MSISVDRRLNARLALAVYVRSLGTH